MVVTYDGHSTGKLEEFNRMNGEEINCSQTESMGGDTQQEWGKWDLGKNNTEFRHDKTERRDRAWRGVEL